MVLERLFGKKDSNEGYGPHVKVRPNGSRYVDADEHFRNNEDWMKKIDQLDSLYEKEAEEKTTGNKDAR